MWIDGLFVKLLDKLNPTIWFILKKYYDRSKGLISLNNNIFSEFFTINCGAKQGGIYLFNYLVNDLLIECSEANLGAVFGNLNVLILMYADDIFLISPNDSQLQNLLDICSN